MTLAKIVGIAMAGGLLVYAAITISGTNAPAAAGMLFFIVSLGIALAIVARHWKIHKQDLGFFLFEAVAVCGIFSLLLGGAMAYADDAHNNEIVMQEAMIQADKLAGESQDYATQVAYLESELSRYVKSNDALEEKIRQEKAKPMVLPQPRPRTRIIIEEAEEVEEAFAASDPEEAQETDEAQDLTPAVLASQLSADAALAQSSVPSDTGSEDEGSDSLGSDWEDETEDDYYDWDELDDREKLILLRLYYQQLEEDEDSRSGDEITLQRTFHDEDDEDDDDDWEGWEDDD